MSGPQPGDLIAVGDDMIALTESEIRIATGVNLTTGEQRTVVTLTLDGVRRTREPVHLELLLSPADAGRLGILLCEACSDAAVAEQKAKDQ